MPAGIVARVDGVQGGVITKAQFEHWLATLAHSGRPPGSNQAGIDPPRYSRCIAGLRAAVPAAAAHLPAPSQNQLKQRCAHTYAGLRTQAMQFLIQSVWLMGDAQQHGVSISQGELDRGVAQTKATQFGGEAGFKRFQQISGESVADFRFRVRLDLLATKLLHKVGAGSRQPTQAEITAYYNGHRRSFAQPERRDVLLVVTKTGGEALQARHELQAGESFSTVSHRHSIDGDSKRSGGRLSDVLRGQRHDAAFDAAVFASSPGRLAGPVRAAAGWLVFEVSKLIPARQLTLGQARAQVIAALQAPEQRATFQRFVQASARRWMARTHCDPGYAVAGCAGASQKS